MNTKLRYLLIQALALPMAALAAQTTFFSDNFSTGSTLNQTPGTPTGSSTSYELISSKNWVPNPPILSSGDLGFGIAATTSGSIEVQAVFTNLPIALTTVGNHIEMTVVFTNTAGLMTSNNTLLAFGLYNSGGSYPVAGGINGTAVNTVSDHVDDGVKGWAGYVGQNATSGNNSRIMTRASQTGPDNRNQDLVTSGSGSSAYGNPGAATVGSTSPSTVILTTGARYTAVLSITLTAESTLAITNSLYDGPDTGGTLLSQFGGVASVGTFLTSGFDGLAIGWRETGTSPNTKPTTIDISSIVISGDVTAISAPPNITSQPVSVTVPNGGSTAFSVDANGFNVTYQWHRYGTNLLNGGSISGATTDQLVVSPAGAADVASGANGYYVTVFGAGGFSTNSTVSSLTLGTAKNLVWSGTGSTWDLGTTADWLNGGSPATFNYGDNITFDNTGVAQKLVTLNGKYLSAASVTINFDSLVDSYSFTGSGNFAGPGQLRVTGSGGLALYNTNSYSGGTLISNANAYVAVNSYAGLGTGPITLAKAGGLMEIFQAGSATLGIAGDIVVADDFKISYLSTSLPFGAVLFGNLSGTTGKTLTIDRQVGTDPSRFRIYGTSTVYDGNLFLNDSKVVWALYQGSGSQTYNGVISGPGSLIQRGNGTTILTGANTYTGGTTPTAGAIGFGSDTVGNVTAGPIGTAPLYLAPEAPNLTGSGTVLASGGSRTIANPLQYPSATNNLTLIIGGTNNLTFSGPYTLNGNDGLGNPTNRTIQVTNTASTRFTMGISDNGLGYGLIKTGNGVLYLDGANTYTGLTTNAAGRLAGSGSIASPVAVGTNGVMGGGSAAAIGTLTINNSLTLNGGAFIRVNKSLSPAQSNDVVSVSGSLANLGTGTITVTNLGTALQPGDTLRIFNKALTGGNTMTVTGAGVNWNNNLAVDGTIQVASIIVTSPPGFSASGVARLPDGNVSLTATGAIGSSFKLWASTNVALTPVTTTWTLLSNGTVTVSPFTINDLTATNYSRRFYQFSAP